MAHASTFLSPHYANLDASSLSVNSFSSEMNPSAQFSHAYESMGVVDGVPAETMPGAEEFRGFQNLLAGSTGLFSRPNVDQFWKAKVMVDWVCRSSSAKESKKLPRVGNFIDSHKTSGTDLARLASLLAGWLIAAPSARRQAQIEELLGQVFKRAPQLFSSGNLLQPQLFGAIQQSMQGIADALVTFRGDYISQRDLDTLQTGLACLDKFEKAVQSTKPQLAVLPNFARDLRALASTLGDVKVPKSSDCASVDGITPFALYAQALDAKASKIARRLTELIK